MTFGKMHHLGDAPVQTLRIGPLVNISDEYNPDSLHHLKLSGEAWRKFCLEQDYNLNASMPDIWHLAVTLQSNNPNQHYNSMRSALNRWSCNINCAALGPRWAKRHSKQWRWFATYEDDPDDDDKTPHWHLIMTPGHGLSPKRTNDLLAVERRNRRIGNTRVFLPERLPSVRTSFEKLWRRHMFNGTAVTKFLTDPDDDQRWVKYIMKNLEARRSHTPSRMSDAQQRVVIWSQFQNRSSNLHSRA